MTAPIDPEIEAAPQEADDYPEPGTDDEKMWDIHMQLALDAADRQASAEMTTAPRVTQVLR